VISEPGICCATNRPTAGACRRGGKEALSAEEAGRIRQWIAKRTPDPLERPFALWTSRAVRELIERRFAKRLALRR
jgi:hypothetical protein